MLPPLFPLSFFLVSLVPLSHPVLSWPLPSFHVLSLFIMGDAVCLPAPPILVNVMWSQGQDQVVNSSTFYASTGWSRRSLVRLVVQDVSGEHMETRRWSRALTSSGSAVRAWNGAQMSALGLWLPQTWSVSLQQRNDVPMIPMVFRY